MTKQLLLLAFTCSSLALAAQTLPKKYVLLEHFTNTKCPICASKNPAFYSLIQQYPHDVHHLSIHPPVPYNSCLIYLSNPTENVVRSNVYGIFGTPLVALNGALVPANTPMLPAATLQSALGKTSPISIQVQESGAAPVKTVQITVRTHGNVPAGAYKLYAAVAEKTVNYSSPNGEKEHYNVFRAMLPNVYGQSITLPPVGGSASFGYTYNFTPPSGWTSNFDSLYVLAFVQDTIAKEVLNSGTRFDGTVLGAEEAGAPQAIRVQPNPVTDQATVLLPEGEQAEQVALYALGGARVRYTAETAMTNAVQVPVADLPRGIYLLKIISRKGIYVGKMVKE